MLRSLPWYIATSFMCDQIIRRQFCMTMDDIFFTLLYLMARYVFLELPYQEVLTQTKYNATPPEEDDAASELEVNEDWENLSSKEAYKIKKAAELV